MGIFPRGENKQYFARWIFNAFMIAHTVRPSSFIKIGKRATDHRRLKATWKDAANLYLFDSIEMKGATQHNFTTAQNNQI